MRIIDLEKVSGTRVSSAILDGRGGMKLVVLIRTLDGKVKDYVFHAASGDQVKRLTKEAKEDIKKLKQDFSALS